jgi:hypothetical protein
VASEVGPWSTRLSLKTDIPCPTEQVYKDIYGNDYLDKLFDVSSGLFLSSELHASFDRFEWSIYCGDVSSACLSRLNIPSRRR